MNPTSLTATSCAASSRYAAPSLRYGPSGDATQPAATGFARAGSALPAINDRRLTGSARPFTPRLNGTREIGAAALSADTRTRAYHRQHSSTTTRLHLIHAAKLCNEWGPPLTDWPSPIF